MTLTTAIALTAGLAFLLLIVLSWRPHYRLHRSLLKTALIVVLSACLSYLVMPDFRVIAFVALDVILVVGTWYLARRATRLWPVIWIGFLLLLLLLVKLPERQETALTVSPALWVGFSYMALRLIHLMMDARRGRFGDATLLETVNYAVHPATLVAGPIDRVQHSVSEQRCEPSRVYIAEGGWRIFLGLFKKLALATVCASVVQTISIVDTNTAGAWIWLLAYGFYLYFDFAAYSDIAIGVGRLMGIRLPENFANPYLQPNVTRFWQSWHITLSNWLRDYLFFPLSRTLLRRFGQKYAVPIQFISHVVTMALCGLWHGLTFGFLAWGVWHGIGLFAAAQMPAVRRRLNLPETPKPVGIVVTFLFVTLGWVFFTHGITLSGVLFRRLFSLG